MILLSRPVTVVVHTEHAVRIEHCLLYILTPLRCADGGNNHATISDSYWASGVIVNNDRHMYTNSDLLKMAIMPVLTSSSPTAAAFPFARR